MPLFECLVSLEVVEKKERFETKFSQRRLRSSCLVVLVNFSLEF